jgi:hypothetical protein
MSHLVRFPVDGGALTADTLREAADRQGSIEHQRARLPPEFRPLGERPVFLLEPADVP